MSTGGSSRNKLIVFADGTYIELLNWITEPKEFFDWAPKSPGLIDFALTTPQSAQETHAAVTKRLETKCGDGHLGVRYKDPLFGGRRRKDGQQCEWYVTKPLLDITIIAPAHRPKTTENYFPTGRLDAPFYCHDVTDRNLRVPYTDTSISTHPCGAKGILSVQVLVPRSQVDRYINLYIAVSGIAPDVFDGFRLVPTMSASFALSSPDPAAMRGLQRRVGIEVHAPRDGSDEAWLKERGIGIREVKIFVPAQGQDEVKERALDSEGIGACLVLVVE